MTQQFLITASPVARRVEFTVPGKPVAKGRPRFARHGAHVRTFTPEATERYENLVKMAARAAMRDTQPYEGPVRLIVTSACRSRRVGRRSARTRQPPAPSARRRSRTPTTLSRR